MTTTPTPAKFATPSQRELARHMLCLPHKDMTAYRVGCIPDNQSPAYVDCMNMVDAGMAVDCSYPRIKFFHLTRQGIRAALDPGESMDEKEFLEAALS